jgi:hypothetical protein
MNCCSSTTLTDHVEVKSVDGTGLRTGVQIEEDVDYIYMIKDYVTILAYGYHADRDAWQRAFYRTIFAIAHAPEDLEPMCPASWWSDVQTTARTIIETGNDTHDLNNTRLLFAQLGSIFRYHVGSPNPSEAEGLSNVADIE